MKKPSKNNYLAKKLDPGKTQCQMWHARKRAKERLGINYTEELNLQIISCIKNNKKENDSFSVTFLENQSNRLKLYKLQMKTGKTVNLVYDSFRSQVITFLFPEDSKIIYYYDDIFNNKVNVKNNFGKIWKLKDTDLDIPGEKVIYDNGIWSVTDGILQGKKFKLEDNEIIEII